MMGPVEAELRKHKDCSLTELYGWLPGRRRYGLLSVEAKLVMRYAAKAVTGMDLGPNQYWLPDIMSEAIEAAEALGL